MDGRSNGRAHPGLPGRTRAAHRSPESPSYEDGGADPLPPAREQLPLPRRRQQAHLNPQLRTPGSPGEGTPFAAFGPAEPGAPAPTDMDVPTAFRDGTRKGRRDARRGQPPAASP